MYIFIDSSWNVERRVSSVRNNACTGAPARRSCSIYMYIHIFDIQLCIYWLILKCNTTHQNRFLCMTRWCMHKCKKKQQCKYIEVCHKHMLYMYIHWCIHIYVHWLVLKCETTYSCAWYDTCVGSRRSSGSQWAYPRGRCCCGCRWYCCRGHDGECCMHLYARTNTRTHIHKHTQNFTHTHTHSLSHTHARAHAFTLTHTHLHVCAVTVDNVVVASMTANAVSIFTHTRTHTLPLSLALSLSHTSTDKFARAHTHTWLLMMGAVDDVAVLGMTANAVCIFTHTQTRTHTYRHTHTCARARTHTHTQSHTHTYLCGGC